RDLRAMLFSECISSMITQFLRLLIEGFGMNIHFADDFHFVYFILLVLLVFHRKFLSLWNGSEIQMRPKPSARRCPMPCSSSINNACANISSSGCVTAKRNTEPASSAFSCTRGNPHNSCQPMMRRTLAE